MKRFIAIVVYTVCMLVGMWWYMDFGFFGPEVAIGLPMLIGLAFLLVWCVAMWQDKQSNVVTMKDFNEERRVLARERRKG